MDTRPFPVGAGRTRRPLISSLMLGLILIMPVVSGAQVPGARELVGVWEGRHQGPDIKSDSARIEFKEVHGRIRWTMQRAGVIFEREMKAKASGVIVNAEPPRFELEGKYESNTFPAAIGRRLRYTLTLDGNTLEGKAIGVTGNTFPVRFIRRK
jgi:hypothetical protein